jgi:dolichyl-phosphate beta-glucosyltransferase
VPTPEVPPTVTDGPTSATGADLSVVIPAYNEGDRLPRFLADWADAAAGRTSLSVTAIVVDDGSAAEHEARYRDGVRSACERLAQSGSPHRIRYERAPANRGKGAAIRWGWSLSDAGARWLSFIDGDGAVPAREFWRLADLLTGTPEFDVLCGSRVKMAGRSVERSLFRHLQGRTFATLVEECFHLGFYDTQCGMKFFRASRLRPILGRLQEDRWLLDIEILARMQAAGARAVEEPIDCHERGGSALVFGLDPVRMVIGLVGLRSRLRDESPR